MKRKANEIDVIISSALDNLDLIQTLTDCITGFMSFDEDSAHRVGMSVREAVTNAIQHGNRLDLNKSVYICFEAAGQTFRYGEGPGQRLPRRCVTESLIPIIC
jgi:anti-sigma regulatory factor (Ser/Thr protein kinase)